MAKKTYIVEITRVSYASATFTVNANTKKQAKEKALQEAYDTVFYEDNCDYDIDSIHLAWPSKNPEE